VIVVLGAHAEKVRLGLSDDAETVFNEQWESGMGSSIAAGFGALWKNLDGAIAMLVDQPLLTPEHLHNLSQGVTEIVASRYNGVDGVPCYFGRSVFPALMALEGNQGAKEIIRNSPHEAIEWDGGSLDIDTAEDYERLLQQNDH
jgi:molybdenum cofactor cytidylyltransferase